MVDVEHLGPLFEQGTLGEACGSSGVHEDRGVALLGLVLIAAVFVDWRARGYGRLDYAHTLRIVIPGVTLVALAAQATISSFMVSILGLDRK